jgi:hypothetical protein
VLAAVLRVVPIWFGLPYLQARPDEETALGHAIAVLRGDPNPHFFHWPSLTFYVFAALFAVAGGEPSLTAVEQVLLARALVAVIGTATVAVLFVIGRRVAGGVAGLVAALFLAVSILHVRESHFAMTDVIMTFFATASLAVLLRAYDRGEMPAFAGAGVCAGLAASTKYTAATLLAAMGAAQVLMLWRARHSGPVFSIRPWLPSMVFVVLFAVAFVAGSPYAILDYRQFVADFRFDVTHLSEGHVVNLGRGWVSHLVRSLPYGVGLPLFAVAIAGLVPFVRHHRAHALIVGAFALATYASLGTGYTVFFRYVLPLVPVICLIGAIAVVRVPFGSSLAVIATAWALVNCIAFDALLAKKDTRVLAREWLDAHVTPGDTMYEAEDAYAMLDLRTLPVHSWRYDSRAAEFIGAGGRVPDWLVLHESPLWTYASIQPQVRRLAAEKYELAQTVAATRGRARSGVYDLQDAFFLPLSGFHTVVRPGPTILIYRRK